MGIGGLNHDLSDVWNFSDRDTVVHVGENPCQTFHSGGLCGVLVAASARNVVASKWQAVAPFVNPAVADDYRNDVVGLLERQFAVAVSHTWDR